jgi:hypothetical protein
MDTAEKLVRFACEEAGAGKKGHEFEVVAEQTMRPVVRNDIVIGAHLEWQFYIEELNLVLIRRSKHNYVAIDDDSRVFRSSDRRQPRFAEGE